MESNFFFIKDVLPKTYERLYEAEKSVRINHEIDTRRALEELVTEYAKLLDVQWLFTEYKKRIHCTYQDITLDDKISICTGKKKLQELGYDYENKGIILPKIKGLIKNERMNGECRETPTYTFLRQYGNATSHIGNQDSIKVSYATSIAALSAFHAILVKIYNRLPQKTSIKKEFDENLMPIQGQEHLYIIDEAGVPSDAPMSKCQNEFKAHFEESGSGKGTKYALIRQYNKRDVDEMFLHRNIDAIQKTRRERLDDNLPPCMVHSVELSPIENKKSSFYIVTYHFWEEPQPLSNELLEKLDMKTRLYFCTELARCMAELHSIGIYQRMLSYASVYVCDYSAQGKGWKPHLVKFDFAKLEQKQGEKYLTVLGVAQEAKNKIEDESIKKYIDVKDWEQKRWEKADIYALGVLFCDILSGRINQNRAQIEDVMEETIKSLRYSETVDCLDSMIDAIAENRPAALEVQRIMEAEMSKWI